MAIIEGSGSATLAEVGAAAAKALHTINKPCDAGALGHYKFAGATGAIAAGMGSNGQLFSMRWTDATRLCVVTKVICTGVRATTAFAVGTIDIKATIARSFSVSASGGTQVTLTGDNQALRTSFAASLVGDMRIASTAALTAGTQTLDSQDIGFLTTHSSGGVGSATPIIGSIYVPNNGILFDADVARGEHPIVLVQNEGLVVRATVPGTGVWNLGLEIVWSEVTAF